MVLKSFLYSSISFQTLPCCKTTSLVSWRFMSSNACCKDAPCMKRKSLYQINTSSENFIVWNLEKHSSVVDVALRFSFLLRLIWFKNWHCFSRSYTRMLEIIQFYFFMQNIRSLPQINSKRTNKMIQRMFFCIGFTLSLNILSLWQYVPLCTAKSR